ncbi:MAG: hypothetical protein WC773_04170 [Patescibacteria group bacterium]|jgi:hypothetical protein
MSKKHKKKFFKKTVSAPVSTIPISQPDQIPTVSETVTIAAKPVVEPESSLSHSSTLVVKELRRVGFVFGLLIIILVATVIVNAKTDYLQHFSNSFSQFLHINN